MRKSLTEMLAHSPSRGNYTLDRPPERTILHDQREYTESWTLSVNKTTVPGMKPTERCTVTWAQFLRRYHLLFFIDVTTREVYFAGITANPTGAWITQGSRNLFRRHGDRLTGARALVRDRGSQFPCSQHLR
jgi:hypothetical protein